MKRDLNQVMTDLNGDEFADKATLKLMCFSALATPMQEDGAIPMDKKMKQYSLVQKVNAGGIIDLTAEEIALIKERASKLFPLIAFGRMVELLEAEPKLESVKDSA